MPESEIDEIVAKTDGWPITIALLAMQRKRPGMDTSTMAHMELVSSLFERDHFSNYDEAFRLLLVKLSILPGFSLEIIKEISDLDLFDVTRLLQENMFIYYNHTSQLYVFQVMYQSFLAEKHLVLEKEEIKRIYRLAGECFIKHEFSLKALDCFWYSEDYDRFVSVLPNMPTNRRKSREFASSLLFRLESLPQEYVLKHPYVNLAAAFLYMNNMEMDKALQKFDALFEQLDSLEQSPETVHIAGEAYAALGDMSLLHNTDTFHRYYKLACIYLDGPSDIRSHEVLQFGNNGVFFLTNNRPGELERMVNMVMESAVFLETISNGMAHGMEYLFAAEAFFYSFEMQQAKENCLKAIYKAKQKAQHDIVCNAYGLLVRIAVYEGDCRQAKNHLSTCVDYVSNQGRQEVWEIVDCIQSWLYIQLGNLSKVSNWICEGRDHFQHPSLIGRNRIMHPIYLMARENYREAYAALSQMDTLFRKKGLWALRLTAYTMQAICCMKLEDSETAVKYFHLAYEMAECNGIVFPFIEYGNSMRSLINLSRRSENDRFREEWLEGIQLKSTAYAKRHTAMLAEYNQANNVEGSRGIQLTRRELEVLNYVAKGMTQEEIGDYMGISTNGVKKHITGIYNKLGAVNRAHAIRIAAMRGYL